MINSNYPLKQLPLDLKLPVHATFDNFIARNLQVVITLKTQFSLDTRSFFYLWGSESVGKTHLLHACCHEANRLKKTSAYFSMKDISLLHPAVLEGFEQMNCVCIDDLDTIHGKENWQEAIFHFFNKIMDNNGMLVVASTIAPKALNLELPDLGSRLNSGITYHLPVLSDEEKEYLLQKRANARSIDLPHDVVKFMLTHQNRSTKELMNLLDKLEHASLQAKRKITIPFIKEMLSD